MHVLTATTAAQHNHTASFRALAWLVASAALAIAGIDVARMSPMLIPLGWTMASCAAAILVSPFMRAASLAVGDWPEGSES